MADLNLIIGTEAWRGWKEISVTRSMEQAAGTFELKLTDRWPGVDAPRPIDTGAACRVEIHGRPVITGHIDDVEETIEETAHDLVVRGRDKAGDLVDCSAVHKSGEWKDAKLEDIAADLARPFGVTVLALTATGAPFENFRIQEGETAFEAIERACRQRAILPRSDGLGNLILTSGKGIDAPGAALKLGKGGNVLTLSATSSLRDRFSMYTVKGQDAGGGWKTAEDIAGADATVEDGSVPRHRPLILIAEEPGNGPTFEERARWEHTVRRARAKRISATVQGWTDAAGDVWRPGTLAACEFPRYTGQMLITAVRHVLGANGTTTALELVLPGAFDVLKVAEDDGGASW
ncbi:MAG: hypothetical protein HQL35_04990 [Alphaproteobacteria bacterium]|nr:hypothetical protein [Alphaproteobacteria bacterium]